MTKKIFTKRNALLGWTAWRVGKGIAKKKAKSAVPGSTSKSSGKKKPAAILAGLGAAIGGLALLKRKRKSGDSSSSE